MRHPGFLLLGALLSCAPFAASGQDFSTGFEPVDFICAGRLEGRPGAAVTVNLFATLTTSKNPAVDGRRARGASGFSLSLGGEKLKFIAITTAGTIVDEIFSGGLMRIGVVDPERIPDRIPGSEVVPGQPQGEGAIAEVVFSVQERRELPPEGRARVLLVTVETVIPEPGAPGGRIFYQNGKQAEGPPVVNAVAFAGESRLPRREDCFVGLAPQRFILRIEGEAPQGVAGAGSLRIPVPPGERGRGAAFGVIDSNTKETEGAQGWALSIAHTESLVVTLATTSGTLVENLFQSGFQVTHAIDPEIVSNPGGRFQGSEVPADQPQGPGVISAVVLSFNGKKELPPVGPSRVVRMEFEQAEAAAGDAAPSSFGRFFYLDGLQGNGQPVVSSISFKGMSDFPAVRAGLDVTFDPDLSASAHFRRGDANDDGRAEIADAVWILAELFRGGERTRCRDAADADADGAVSPTDAVYLLEFQFLGGAPPTAPHPDCGRGAGATPESCPPGSTACPG